MLPYLPLFVDDYEAATVHLSILEDGAYNRLLRLCWRTPGCKLPNDDAWIMRKMRATSEAEQAAVKLVLAEFFTTGRGKIWSKRLLQVHLQKSVAHAGKVEAGKKGAAAKALKNNKADASTAKAKLKQPEPEPEPREVREEGGGGSASERENFSPRERILEAIGVDPASGLTGRGGRMLGTQADMAIAGQWKSDLGLSWDEIVVQIRETMAAKPDGPPSTFGYFSKPMARLAGVKRAEALRPDDMTPRLDPSTLNPGGKNDRPSERRAFDSAINQLADGLAAGTIDIDTRSRDPWEYARRRLEGRNPADGEHDTGPVFRP